MGGVSAGLRACRGFPCENPLCVLDRPPSPGGLPKRMACPRIEQAGLKAGGKVMASIGANTTGMLLAAVALTGIG